MPAKTYTYTRRYIDRNGQIVERQITQTKQLSGVPRGPKQRVISDETKELVRSLHNEGQSVALIARTNNLSPFMVNKILQETSQTA